VGTTRLCPAGSKNRRLHPAAGSSARIPPCALGISSPRAYLGPKDLQHWLHGLRPLGDFLDLWCGADHAWASIDLEILSSNQQYVAIVPDDMLAVQELYMASEGMDSESVCFNCGMCGLQPIVTTANARPCGNPRRKIRFFCRNRGSTTMLDLLPCPLAPMPPCPVPLNIKNSMRRIDPNSDPLLARPVIAATFSKYAKWLYDNRRTGGDRKPREHCKYAPSYFKNAIDSPSMSINLAGVEPTVGDEEWVGGMVTTLLTLPKVPHPQSVTDNRPVTMLCPKLIIKDSICDDRLKQVVEENNSCMKSKMHTDGPDAIPAMSLLVTRVGAFVHWLGIFIKMRKSYISAIDLSTGKTVATDSITLNGASFTQLPPDPAHKHLGVRMTMTGCFQAEDKHVREEVQRRLDSLRGDEVLSPSLKELAIKAGAVSIFCYSVGLVPWTRPEMDGISKMWSTGYKQAWYKKAARGADATPMILSGGDGGRSCSSACEVWIRSDMNVLDMYDQCLSMPGEIFQLCSYFLHQTCLSHDCWTLNQLQKILRISGRVDPGPVTELLMLRLTWKYLAHGSRSLIDCCQRFCGRSYVRYGSAKRHGIGAANSMRNYSLAGTKPNNVLSCFKGWVTAGS
jgi:hypothetical protein